MICLIFCDILLYYNFLHFHFNNMKSMSCHYQYIFIYIFKRQNLCGFTRPNNYNWLTVILTICCGEEQGWRGALQMWHLQFSLNDGWIRFNKVWCMGRKELSDRPMCQGLVWINGLTSGGGKLGDKFNSPGVANHVLQTRFQKQMISFHNH